LAVRHGFRRMQIEELTNLAESGIHTNHRIFCELNGITEERRPFEPAMVYLPTNEFVDRFTGSEHSLTSVA
jgi:hypothetical protein